MSTGHDTGGRFPLPGSLVLSPGIMETPDLIAGVERGIYVSNFHYTNVVHPKQVVVTGMTRDGLFLVEGGRITAPVRDMRFTQGYLDALEAVEAVGDQRRALEGFMGTTLVPPLRIGSFSFTGTTVDT